MQLGNKFTIIQITYKNMNAESEIDEFLISDVFAKFPGEISSALILNITENYECLYLFGKVSLK